MKRNELKSAILLLLTLTLLCTVSATSCETITLDTDIIPAHCGANNQLFTPLEALSWGTAPDDAFNTLRQKYGENLSFEIQDMPNGHTSVTPNTEYRFPACAYTFDSTYVFSDAGLYNYNLRTVLSFSGSEDLRAFLTGLTGEMLAEFGEADYTNETFVSDYTNADLSSITSEMTWFSGDTFFSIQVVSFMEHVVININTGLTSCIEKYAQFAK